MAYVARPLNCDAAFDTSKLAGKTAVVTGGSSGMGKAFTEALVKAGGHVVFGDVNAEAGEAMASDLERTKFVKCDVTKWEDQLEMFREAVKFSPSGNIDIVVANAGLVSLQDSIFTPETSDEPTKPALKSMNVNLDGVLYTSKLALFYFRRQFAKDPANASPTSLVLQSSMAGYMDFPSLVEYNTSKFAVRGLLRSLRRTEFRFGTRVNLLAPWFMKTPLLKDPSRLGDIDFAEVEDATKAFMHIVSDPDIAGRSVGIVPRSFEARGYLDLEEDDNTSNVMERFEKMASNSAFR